MTAPKHLSCQTSPANQRDIAKAGRGERRHREIKSIDEVLDLRIDAALSDEDQGGDEEDEDGKVQRGLDHLLVAAHRREPFLELAKQIVGPEQADGAQHAKEAEISAERRDEQGGDDHQVNHRGAIVEVVHRVTVREHPAEKFEREKDSEQQVDRSHPGRVGDEGRRDEIGDRSYVDGQEPGLERHRGPAVTVEHAPQPYPEPSQRDWPRAADPPTCCRDRPYRLRHLRRGFRRFH